MNLLTKLQNIVGAKHLLTGADCKRYSDDTTGDYNGNPLAVVRPADTSEVSAIVKLANQSHTAIVPISGNTGLVGGSYSDGAIMLSLERLNSIIDLRPNARIAIVQSGCVVSKLQDGAQDHNLIFPLLFGARDSAMIGGALSTNAGGSNVLRYGSTRALCLGLEVVMPSGEVMDLMSELHKDNSGYDLKDLFIGAEGTLGIITKAVLKLFPKPNIYATAMVALPSLADALQLLNQLQNETGGLVEAFEFIPDSFMQLYAGHFPGSRPVFERDYEVNILLEIASSSEGNAIGEILENCLAKMLETGQILDAIIAQNEAQRAAFWARREASAEVIFAISPRVDSDVCLGLDKVTDFFAQIAPRILKLDKDAKTTCVAHLGDGNVHFSVLPSRDDKKLANQLTEAIEDVVKSLGGSFSAEHGVGLSKRPSMARRKDPVALAAMHRIKAALDPNNIMNPGKVLPD